MEFLPHQDRSACPSYEIASYIDGELDPMHELELEAHFAFCAGCAEELNQQRQFLCGLNASLMNEGEIELPADFTRHIVANAESTVAGLRRPRERYNAIFICCGLLLFAMFALGADAGNVLSGFAGVFEKISAVGSFFAHFVYSFFIGLTVIVRSVANQTPPAVAYSIGVMAVFAILLLVVSRKVIRLLRV